MNIDNERARLVHTGKNVRLIVVVEQIRNGVRLSYFFFLAKRNIINEKHCFFFFSVSFSFCLSSLKSDTLSFSIDRIEQIERRMFYARDY